MKDNRSLFERFDSVESLEQENNRILTEIQKNVEKNNAQNNSFLNKILNFKKEKADKTEKQSFKDFLRQSKKSWIWFGSEKEYKNNKMFVIISLLLLAVFGLISSVTTSLYFGKYFGFTIVENAWLVFGLIEFVYICFSKQKYSIEELSSHSSKKFEQDELGMLFPRKDKTVFVVFRILNFVAIGCDVFLFWSSGPKDYQVLATIFEILYLAATLFSWLMFEHFYSNYCIICVEGYNSQKSEFASLVLMPGANKFISIDEFREKYPELQ